MSVSQPTHISGLLDRTLRSARPSTVVYTSVGACVAVYYAWALLGGGRVLKRLNALKWRVVRFVLAPIINKKIAEASHEVMFVHSKNAPIFEQLPTKGLPHSEVIALAKSVRTELDHSYSTGELSGTVYHGGSAHTEMINAVMEAYQWTNPLHIDVFPAVRKMDAEIVAMCVAMYNGQTSRPDACGALTTGGTESICMAMKCYRDWGKAVLGVQNPEIVLPITAHPAFDKAAHYYCMNIVKVSVDMNTGAVDAKVLEKYITANTVVIVGSACNFPYGAIDPIAELSEIAERYGIGLHVDACLGGFIVPFFKKAGFEDGPVVDFRLPGVSSISCDTHKFGFAPKGTSVVLYESKALRQFQFFAVSEWPGGMYCSPGAPGSKAGNIIAGTWAAMIAMGEDGYVDSCRRIVSTARKMAAGINKIDGLRVLGRPQASVVAFTSDKIDIYLLSTALRERGWHVNPLQFPSGLQFSLTLLQTHEGVMERFLKDCDECMAALLRELQQKKDSNDIEGMRRLTAGGGATLYGSQQRIADRTILNDAMRSLMNGYYDTRPKTTTPS